MNNTCDICNISTFCKALLDIAGNGDIKMKYYYYYYYYYYTILKRKSASAQKKPTNLFFKDFKLPTL